MEVGCQVHFLTSADQEIPDWLGKVTFLGEAETAVRLGIKTSFGDVGLAQATLILSLLSFNPGLVLGITLPHSIG